jgi:diguanylate cyclase (GGDEF)-like protein
VLCEVAARINALLRPGDLLARAGAHRFGVLLADVDAYQTAQFAEIVRDAVSEPKIPLEAGVSVRLTASVGMGALPYDAPAPGHLLRVTEQALDAARTAGGNRSHNWQGPVNLNALAMRY